MSDDELNRSDAVSKNSSASETENPAKLASAIKTSGDDKDPASDGKAQTVNADSKTEKKTAPTAKSPAHHGKSHHKRGGLLSRIPWSGAIALLVFLGVAYLLNDKINNQAFDSKVQIDQLKQQLSSQLQSAAEKYDEQQQALRQARNELAQLQTQLSSEQTRGAQERLDLEAKIKQVQTEAAAKGKDPLRWRVAEVDYLMALANHRLQLSNDVDTARTALLDADKRLRQIADPGLNVVRMALADEIKSLDGVEQPDIAGMANQLTALVGGIEQLPLINRDRKREPLHADIDKKVSSWRELPSMLWSEIRGLIVIRRHDHPIEPLLPPQEKHFLAQNLGLKLEQARLALLRQDEAVFQANIADTKGWVERYFDKQEAPVQAALQTLESLQNAKLKPALPDISKSLRELRAWRQARSDA